MKENHSAAPGVRIQPNNASSSDRAIPEWRRSVQGGEVFFDRVACILPAYRTGTPEWYRRIAALEDNKGNATQARSCREAADRIELRSMQRVLGEHVYLTTSAAHVLAAILRSGCKMPTGAQRWMAQQALESWLPHLPRAERREVVAMLRECPVRVLGKELAAVVAAEDCAATERE